MKDFKTQIETFRNWNAFLQCVHTQLDDEELNKTCERARVTKNTLIRWLKGDIPALKPFLRFIESAQETIENQLKFTGHTTFK